MVAGSSEEAQRIRTSRNILLRRLSPHDHKLLEPYISTVPIARGSKIMPADVDIEAIYFPDSAIFSLVDNIGALRPAEIAAVGHEGMLGWPALLGCTRSPHEAICQTPGMMLRVPIKAVQAGCAQSASLWSSFLQFVHIIIVQMARAIASHLRDPLEQRVARWLLMRHDRVGGDVLLVHHDEIANHLAVRRASVTDRLHLLEGDRMIRCNRGRIAIRDRSALEGLAGGSYGVVEAQYRSLIAQFGKSLASAQAD